MPLNPFLSKVMIYHEVHKLSRNGFSVTYISRFLGLNWRTVKRLLSIEDDRIYEQYLISCSDKDKILEPYEGFVKSKLDQYKDTSSAQMHDWLKEHFPEFPEVSPKTVFNFIAWVRQKYSIPKMDTSRICEMVEETPYGLQAQVDFGVYNMRNNRGTRIKVYFFSMVLSRSRYKYVFFSTDPFTAHTAIDAHERAFTFMEGKAETLVYDQDRVFMVNENYGDLILTEAFKTYTSRCGFKLHFCRKADPQSKGKIENFIKYIKQNFLYNRPFSAIDILNAEALGWLSRTANKLPHGFTRKSPASEWEIEKPFLKPLNAIIIPIQDALEYAVRKDNSFSYKGNFYSLPSATYKGRGSRVLLEIQGASIVIYDLDHRELCRHKTSSSRGEKIINNDHRRDKNLGIKELEDQFCALANEPQKAIQLMEAIHRDKPRYVRDQLLILLQVARSVPASIIDQSLQFCCDQHICGAADFKAIVAHYHQMEADPSPQSIITLTMALNPLNNKPPDQALIQPATSSINDYDMF
jgi:hypothetical protein